MIRLFVGLELPALLRDRLKPLQTGLPDARWVAPENLHLTLRFIGEVDEPMAEDIDAALAEIAGPPVSLSFNGMGSFQSGNKVRAVWAAADGGAALRHLQAGIESACVRAGLEPEGRKFTPHVTLARLQRAPAAKVAGYLAANDALRAGPAEIHAYTLFRSHLGRRGAAYEALVRYAMEG